MQKNKFLLGLCITVLVLLHLTGCVGYKLGSMLEDDIQTVCIPTFINETEEPNIEIETTQAVIRQFQQDGSLRVASCDDADVRLDVVLKKYELKPLSYDRHLETTADEYRVWITASYVLIQQSTGKVVSEYPKLKGQSTFEFAGDLSLMKRQALPKTARDLGHEIVEHIVEAW